MQATLYVDPGAAPAAAAAARIVQPPKAGDTITGSATWYCCSRAGAARRWWRCPAHWAVITTAPAPRTVTVCADRCAVLPVADYCGCYWGTADQKVADLSPEAWAAISDSPTSSWSDHSHHPPRRLRSCSLPGRALATR